MAVDIFSLRQTLEVRSVAPHFCHYNIVFDVQLVLPMSNALLFPYATGAQLNPTEFVDYVGWLTTFEQSDCGAHRRHQSRPEIICPTDFRINSILSSDQPSSNIPSGKTKIRSNAASKRATITTKAKKRIRTIFTNKQLKTLEYYFHQQPYMVGQDRVNVAKELSLTEAQVKVWFQNRRIKQRKSEHEKRISMLKQNSFDCINDSSVTM